MGATCSRFTARCPATRPRSCARSPAETEALGLGEVWLKDENGRFGLPAFKIAGASWALERLLAVAPGRRAAYGPPARAITVVPSRARRRSAGLAARIFLPAATSEARAAAIASEGAEVVRVAGVYEDAVAATARRPRARRRDARGRRLRRVRSGRALGVRRLLDDFAEAAEQADAPFDVVLCQIGVGSFASAAIRFACHQDPRAVAIGVEPATAACATASLAAGRPVVVDTPGTSMAGLNCATPSHAAWPVLRDGLPGSVVIGDDEARTAMRDLAALGIVAGDCGAASLAALRALVRDPLCRAARASRGTRQNQPGATDFDRGRDRSRLLR